MTDQSAFTIGYRERMTARFEQLLDDLANQRLKHLGRFKDSGEQGPAPVGTVFNNYDEAVRRHGIPTSFADQRKRKREPRTPAAWEVEEPRSVRERLGITEDQWDAIPDA